MDVAWLSWQQKTQQPLGLSVGQQAVKQKREAFQCDTRADLKTVDAALIYINMNINICINMDINIYSLKTIGETQFSQIFNILGKGILCSPRLHLFDQKYSRN